MIETHFKIVVLDETSTWSDSFIEASGGAIWAAYLFDSLRPVNCCEIVTSYELWPLYVTPRFDNEEGDIHSRLNSEHTDIRYIHCRAIDRKDRKYIYDFGHVTEIEDTWEEYRAFIEEDAKANVPIDIPMDPGFHLVRNARCNVFRACDNEATTYVHSKRFGGVAACAYCARLIGESDE